MGDILDEFDRFSPKNIDDVRSLMTELRMPTPRNVKISKDATAAESKVGQIITYRLIEYMNIKNTNAESIMTALTKIQDIVTNFTKEVRTQTLKIELTPKLFRELTAHDLKKHLHGAYKDAIEKAIHELDRNNKWTDYDFSLKEYYMDNRLSGI
jgi:hypothetical protein